MAFSDILNLREFASDFAGGLLTALLIFQDQSMMTKVTISAVYAASHLVYDVIGSYFQGAVAGITGSNVLGSVFAYGVEVGVVAGVFFAFNKWLYSDRLSWKSILLYTLIAVPIGDRISVAIGGVSSFMPTSSAPKV